MANNSFAPLFAGLLVLVFILGFGYLNKKNIKNNNLDSMGVFNVY